MMLAANVRMRVYSVLYLNYNTIEEFHYYLTRSDNARPLWYRELRKVELGVSPTVSYNRYKLLFLSKGFFSHIQVIDPVVL
jgi:hypothetical protein